MDYTPPPQIQPPAWLKNDALTKGLYYGSQAGLLGDYLQTRNIMQAGREMNPIPKAIGPEAYFSGLMAANHYLVPKLPREYQNMVRGGLLAAQLASIINNRKVGFGFNF